MRKLRLSKVKQLARNCTAGKWQKPSQTQACGILELMSLHSLLLAFHLAGPLHSEGSTFLKQWGCLPALVVAIALKCDELFTPLKLGLKCVKS